MADEDTAVEETEETADVDTSTEVDAEETKVTPEDDWKAKARKHEKASKQTRQELEAAQAKIKEYEDRDKTEAEKAEEARKALEVRAANAESALLRSKVGAKHNLPPEVADLLKGDTEEEVEAHAESLAALVKSPVTPTVDTDAGKGSSSSGEPSFNDIIRGASARG